MKHLLLVLFLFATVFSSLAQAPTTPSTNAVFAETQKEGTYLTFTATRGNGTRRLVIAKQGSAVTARPQDGVSYIANANFGQGFEIAPGEFIVYSNNGTSFTINNLEPATVYHFAIFEYNLDGASPLYLVSSFLATSTNSASPPLTQASQLSFSNVSGNRFRLSWTSGSGRGRMVVAREAGAVNITPTNLFTYSPNTIFGNGTNLGDGNYVVYKNNTNTVDLTNLKTGTSYHVAVFEYNGNSQPVFLTPTTAIATITTTARPTTPASALSVQLVEGSRMRLSWTAGNGRERLVIARKDNPVSAIPQDETTYTADSRFGNGTAVQPGEFVLYRGSGTVLDVDQLEHGSTYHFAVFEYDQNSAGLPMYLTSSIARINGTTLSAPTVQPSNIVFSAVTANSVQLTWTNGNGSRRLLVGRRGGPVTGIPENYRSYSASSSFGSGATINGDNYTLFWSNANTITIGSLQPGGEYHFALFEANGSQAPVYLLDEPARASITLSNRPTVPASNMNFSLIDGNSFRTSFTRGDGSARLIIARAGAAVTALPQDGQVYTANAAVGLGTEVLPGQFVVYNGIGTSLDLSGMAIGTNYHFAVFEYSGTGSATQYLVNSFLQGSQSTVSIPTVSASDLVVSAVTNNAMTLAFTRGNGSRRLVIAKAGAPVDVDPVSLTNYAASSNINTAAHLGGGNYVVYNNTGVSVSIAGLQAGVTYHFAVFEANGSTAPVFKTTEPARGTGTTSGRPTQASSSISFTQIEPNSARVSWSNGNGSRRIVVAREGAAVSFRPQDGTIYSGNALYGQGDQVLPGEFVLLDGTVTNMTVGGLDPGKTYHLAIFDYSGSGTEAMYLLSPFGTANWQTLARPVVPASNILFSAIGATSATINWTAGNGSHRLVVVRANQPVDFQPVDFQSYVASTVFGNRPGSAGQSIVHVGSSNSVTITGLTEGEQYHAIVYEMNGQSAPVYLLTGAPSAFFTTNGAPTIPASNASWITLSNSSVKLSWNNGNGQRRMVLGKAVTPVDASPLNNQTYLANAAFGSGQQLGTGNYILYNGTGNEVDITNLDARTDYYFTVLEFNQVGSTIVLYQLANPATVLLPADAILPVTWRSFRGTAEADRLKLEWSTSAEYSNRHFEVEESEDGHRFRLVGTVNAGQQGAGINRYTWSGRALPGKSYYRIKQVDENGKFSYSSVVVINRQEDSGIRVLQNPVRDAVRIQVSDALLGAGVRLISANGTVVYSGRVQANLLVIPRYSWRPGLYYLTVSTSTGKIITKPVAFE